MRVQNEIGITEFGCLEPVGKHQLVASHYDHTEIHTSVSLPEVRKTHSRISSKSVCCCPGNNRIHDKLGQPCSIDCKISS
jgi:hypothetical protein